MANNFIAMKKDEFYKKKKNNKEQKRFLQTKNLIFLS